MVAVADSCNRRASLVVSLMSLVVPFSIPFFMLHVVQGMIGLSHTLFGDHGFFLFRTIEVDQAGLSRLSVGSAEWISSSAHLAG